MIALERLFKGSFFRLIAKLTSILIAFLLLPVIVKVLGETDYGIWVLVASLGGYYGALDFGLSSAVIRFVSKNIDNKEKINEYMATSFYAFVFFGVAILAIIICAILVYRFNLDIIETRTEMILVLVFITTLSTSISFLSKSSLGILSSFLFYDYIALVQFVSVILKGFVSFYLLTNGGGIVELTLVLLAASVFETIFLLYFSIKKYNYEFFNIKFFSSKTLKELFGYGKYTFIAQISDIIRNYSLPFLIAASIDIKNVTPFAIATRLWSMAGTLCSSMLSIFTPVFSRFDRISELDKIRCFYLNTIKIANLAGNYISVMILAMMQPFLKLWLGDEYNQDIYILANILSISMIASISQMPTVNLLYGISENKKYAISNFIQGAVILGFSWVLIDVYGLIGVVIVSSIVGVITKLGIQLSFAANALNIKMCELYLITFKYLSMPIMYGICVKLSLLYISLATWFQFFIYGLLLTIIYASLIYVFVLSAKEKVIMTTFGKST